MSKTQKNNTRPTRSRSIALIICDHYGVAPERLRLPVTRQEMRARNACIYALRELKGLTYPEIGAFFLLSANGIYAVLSKFRKKFDEIKIVDEIFLKKSIQKPTPR